MNRILFTDLLLVTTVLAASLCIAHGLLTTSTSSLIGALLVALIGGLGWLALRCPARAQKETASDILR